MRYVLAFFIKSLVFKANNDFLICLIAGDKKCSLNKLKKILEKKDVAMASAEEVKANTAGHEAAVIYQNKINQEKIDRASAKTKLKNLGLTDDEIKALFHEE